jgi:hypothetical protein
MFDPTDGTNNMTIEHITAAVTLVLNLLLSKRLSKKVIQTM